MSECDCRRGCLPYGIVTFMAFVAFFGSCGNASSSRVSELEDRVAQLERKEPR